LIEKETSEGLVSYKVSGVRHDEHRC